MNYDELDVSVDPSGDIIVTSMVDDAVYIQGSQTLEDPPEYAAALFQLTITKAEAADYVFDTEGVDVADTNDLHEDVIKNVVMHYVDIKDSWSLVK